VPVLLGTGSSVVVVINAPDDIFHLLDNEHDVRESLWDVIIRFRTRKRVSNRKALPDP
jgi:hypothetical protein